MNKKVIIHIGPGKTGSSFLQYFLLSNKKALAKQGVYYPDHPLDSNGISSGHIINVSDNRDNSFIFSAEKIKLIRNEFNDSSCHTLLLSSEKFFKRQELLESFPLATYIGYLRNPMELITSAYVQSIKRRNVTDVINPQITHSVIRTMINFYKNHHFILRPYYKNCKNWHIYKDFLNACNIELNSDFKIPINPINPTYSYPALEFKRLLNHFNLNGKISKQTDVCLQKHQGDSHYSLLSDEFYNQHKEENITSIQTLLEKTGNLEWTDDYLAYLKKQKNNPYVKQTNRSNHFKIIFYLAKSNLALLKKIHNHILRSNIKHPHKKMLLMQVNLIRLTRFLKKKLSI